MLTVPYEKLYRIPPLRVEEGIPVFSRADDEYSANYARIALDHLRAAKPGNENPFIETALWEEMERSTRDLVRKHLPPTCRILDAGVGLGRVLRPFRALDRHGIDISIDYLRVAKAAGFEVAFAKLEEAPYHDGMFDGVVACDILEHVIDLHRCAEQLVRVLRPGGTLIVRTPYLDDLDVYLDPDLPYDFIHLRSFDVATLRLLFEKVHRCVYVEHTFVARYLKGAPRMKLRQLKQSSPLLQRLAGVPDEGDPLSVLKRATRVSEEEFIHWIYDLRDRHPSLFEEVASELVHGLEVNLVFRKRPA